MRIVLNPKYKSFESFVSLVPAIFRTEGTTIYKARNEIKTFSVGGEVLNVKQYKVPFLLNRIIYTWFRKPKAIRAYEYAKQLTSMGVNTAAPVAYIMQYRSGLIYRSYFISKQIEAQTIYHVGELPPNKSQEIFIALGRYAAALHTKGVYHADFSPGNILYAETSEGYDFYLIDINRMTFGEVSIDKGCRNFARIWGNTEAFRLMAKSYAEARGADIEECTDRILKYRDTFWKKYQRKHPLEFTY